jgi:predicted nucleotide-binding protein
VSLEVGYLLGLRKPVLLLKDQTLPRLPSDLVGRLYTEFNTFDVKGTLPAGIQHWLVNKKLLKRDLSTNP